MPGHRRACFRSCLAFFFSPSVCAAEAQVGLKKYVACHGSFLTASCLKCKKKRKAEDIRVSAEPPSTGIRSFALFLLRLPLPLL